MKSLISNIAPTLFGILFVGLWLNGCIHSNGKHKDDASWLSDSPLAIYRGVEFFWHDDFADVDWKERINNDAMVLTNLLNNSTGKEGLDKVNTEIENFSKKILQYPKDKIDSLKKAGGLYIRYSETVVNDLYVYVEYLIKDSLINPNKWDVKSRVIGDSLGLLYNQPIKESEMAPIDTLIGEMATNVKFGEKKKVEIILSQLRLRQPELHQLFLNTYFRIFKEKYEQYH